MADDLAVSAESGKRSTRKTNVLTQEQALEILQQALREYQKTGGRVNLSPLYHNGEQHIAIILAGVALDDGNLVAINGNGEHG